MKRERKELGEKSGGDHGLTWRRGPILGKGAFGSVYLAISNASAGSLGRFPQQMAVKSAEYSISRSLRKEREILNRLRGSPYVIKCFGEEITTGDKDGEVVYNLLLEYAPGGSLRDRIKDSGGVGLPESDVRRYARSILRGMKHIHDRGYVHLDIKPENILLVPCGGTKFVAKICDFGLARNAERTKSSLRVRGTAVYFSPEAAVEGMQEAPSDVWAIGCVVLEMLTGRRVWDRREHSNVIEISTDGPEEGKAVVDKWTFEIPSGISEEGKEFLKGCFVRNPVDRSSVHMLLKLPFVSHVDEEVLEVESTLELNAKGENSVLSLSETDEKDSESCSSPKPVEDYNEGVEESEARDRNYKEPSLVMVEHPSICSLLEDVNEDIGDRKGSEYDSMLFEPSMVSVEPTSENHKKRSRKDGDSLDPVITHERGRPVDDETMQAHKRRKRMPGSDAD